jgi:hypothetical protein
MDIREIEWGSKDRFDLAGWAPVEGSCEHCNETLGSIKRLEIIE